MTSTALVSSWLAPETGGLLAHISPDAATLSAPISRPQTEILSGLLFAQDPAHADIKINCNRKQAAPGQNTPRRIGSNPNIANATTVTQQLVRGFFGLTLVGGLCWPVTPVVTPAVTASYTCADNTTVTCLPDGRSRARPTAIRGS